MLGGNGKINILFLMMQMEMGGAERLVHTLAGSLDRTIFTPSVAWFQGKRALKAFQDLEVPLHHIPKIKRVDFTAMKRLSGIIEENNIHIVNAHHFMPLVYSFYGSKIAHSGKLFCTIHSEWEVESLALKWRIAGNLLLKQADGIIGVNELVSQAARDTFRLDPAKSFTIHNGVDLAAFAHGNRKAALRKQLGIAAGDKIIGVVANLKKIKNHILLLRAFSELIKDMGNVSLILVGQGFTSDPDNTEPEIRSFISGENLGGKALLLGYRADIPDLLGIMDIFCLPSLKEGLPIGLIEAMAAGLPVVGTSVEGIRDVIKPGRNGFLVAPGDVAALKRLLHTLLNDDSLRYTLGQESRYLAKSAYSLDQCISKYEQLFRASLQVPPADMPYAGLGTISGH